MTTKCTKHSKTLKYICHKCNILMCSACTLDHCKQQLDHTIHCELVDNNSNNNNNENKDESQLSKTIQNKLTIDNNNNNKSSYIFSTHRQRGVTLINTTNNNVIEQIKLDYDFHCTTSSIVSIGEHIYVFGGQGNPLKWVRFSMRSKSIELIANTEVIEGGAFIAACYDGQDHIYLMGGNPRNDRIDRFNIRTLQFEAYHKLPWVFDDCQVSTMIYKGSLYIVPYDDLYVFEFNLANKTIVEHRIATCAISACNDGNGPIHQIQRRNQTID
ncbi:hypothetical protein PPL_08273 [Heterostelium album PN500]|uniref:B box-type domain-containing protein n=1 Tax=Heterostelium pallidum (strain ATCC 26659 / Pp 5 / PN500) TaxID=670386 RepID=D3BHQ9_HETP5|nr:hypothetical protein PPL_08273 [Heterostelium album PN500]EFA78809.1 hypothetical protein PPL_08273 [Heterostelium album PN500]|eukprot:XP_020430933.1 hypothetical protein PPL_08273 [Heterostelium album PN500]